jgi:hypothetical protein
MVKYILSSTSTLYFVKKATFHTIDGSLFDDYAGHEADREQSLAILNDIGR